VFLARADWHNCSLTVYLRSYIEYSGVRWGYQCRSLWSDEHGSFKSVPTHTCTTSLSYRDLVRINGDASGIVRQGTAKC
jgi:hypothetical protein